MNVKGTMVAIFVMVVFFMTGCVKETVTGATKVEKPSISIRSDNHYYYFTEAQIQRKKGNLDKAIILLKKAVESDPESIYLQRELATVYLQNKEDQNAMVLLENLLKKHPDDVRALILYGGIKQLRKEK